MLYMTDIPKDLDSMPSVHQTEKPAKEQHGLTIAIPSAPSEILGLNNSILS